MYLMIISQYLLNLLIAVCSILNSSFDVFSLDIFNELLLKNND